MDYLTFRNTFEPLDLVSTGQIHQLFPDFDSRRLVEWQHKGYLEKIVNRWYRFRGKEASELSVFFIANRIYQPSYISLEMAFSFHGLIPEGVYTYTSITTRKPQTLDTPVGTLSYRHLKPPLFFGYQLLRWQDKPVLVADPAKALLDFLYLNPQLTTPEDMAELRFNRDVFAEKVNRPQLETYRQLFHNQALTKRINTFLETYAGTD